jgi:outer membrane receptor protein involved in Fe transport
MRALGLVRVLAVSIFLLLPCAAWAQSSISGVVRDASGGVLPGVTVEAASPVLIEGVRSAVTDAQGIYKVVDLRPGTYTVTFSLPGFRSLKRDGLNLPAEFSATVNADLAVGALEETVTVSGEAPVVDVKSSRAQTQFEKSTIEALPGAGRLTVLSDIVPGATLTQEFNRGVGGTSDRTQTRYSVHGGPEAQPYVDGMNQQLPNSTQGVFVYNQLQIQEVVVETSGVGADRDSGGMQINMIPKDGGNQFSGIATVAYSGPKLAAKNITPELLARHLDPNRVGSLKKFRDTGEGFGGPIKRDKLWFFVAAREGVTQQFADGVYWNKAQQPQSYLYDPDLSRPASTNDYSKDYSARVTWQASQKNKLAFSSSFQSNCNCVFNLLTGGRTTPEAAGEHHYYPNYNPAFSWTNTLSNRILIEAGVSAQNLDQNDTRAGGLSGNEQGSDRIIRITDQGLNLSYGAPTTTRSVPRRQYQERFALSYITGSHSVKVGTNIRRTSQGNPAGDAQNKFLNGPGISYRFNNGTPNQVTLFDAPWAFQETLWDSAFYAQDQWSVTRRLTLNLGVRYNDIDASTPEQVLGAGFFVPERRLPAMKHIPHYQNLNPRLGFAYDLFGNGKTAIKGSLGQYPEIIKVATGNPANNLSRTTNRTWSDINPRNFVPDCDLLNPVANGECGPWSDLNFGKQTAGTRYSEDALTGFNKQYQNWQASVSLQHELHPGVGLNLGYYRTWYGGRCGGSGLTNTVTCLLVTDNQKVTPSDFNEYCITAPTNPALPNSGQQLCGLFDVKPSLFGQSDNLARPASDLGGKLTRVYNGFDATVNARFLTRGQLSGGLSMGRTVTNNCLVVDSPQDARPGFCKVTPPWSAGSQVKLMVIYPLPWDISTSAIYQNSSGIPITASYVVANAAIAPSLQRNLSDCAVGAATCNANRTIELIPPSTLFEPRLQQVDLRFSRVFTLGGTRRIRPSLDVYNLLNASNVINMNVTYGPSWKDAVQILSGRLLRFGAQFDF